LTSPAIGKRKTRAVPGIEAGDCRPLAEPTGKLAGAWEKEEVGTEIEEAVEVGKKVMEEVGNCT